MLLHYYMYVTLVSLQHGMNIMRLHAHGGKFRKCRISYKYLALVFHLLVGLYLCNALALIAQVFNLWRVYVNYRYVQVLSTQYKTNLHRCRVYSMSLHKIH